MSIALTKRPPPRLMITLFVHCVVVVFGAPLLVVLLWGADQEKQSGALVAQAMAYAGALFLFCVPLAIVAILSGLVFLLISRVEPRFFQHLAGVCAGAITGYLTVSMRSDSAVLYTPVLVSGAVFGLILPLLWRAPLFFTRRKDTSAA